MVYQTVERGSRYMQSCLLSRRQRAIQIDYGQGFALKSRHGGLRWQSPILLALVSTMNAGGSGLQMVPGAQASNAGKLHAATGH